MYLQQDNQTALYQASSSGHDEVVRVLLAAKATVNTQSKVSFFANTFLPICCYHCFPTKYSRDRHLSG